MGITFDNVFILSIRKIQKAITYLDRDWIISVFVFVQRPCFCITSNLAPRVGNAINWKVVMHVVQKILILIDIFKKGYN